MNELTTFEKWVYNTYLATIAKASKRAFRYRKDFTKIKNADYVALKKLSSFFSLNSNVRPEDFIAAPFQIFKDDCYQPLSFYNSPRAISCYKTLIQQRERGDPDSPETMSFSLQGLKFVLDFCTDNDLTLNEYKTHKDGNGAHVILTHLREHKLNFYVVHALELRAELYKLGVDWLNLFIVGFDEIFKQTETKFDQSTKLKTKLKQIVEAIDRKTEQINRNELNV